MPKWIPDNAEVEAELLREVGLSSFDELFADVPKSVRAKRLGLAEGREERAVVDEVTRILGRNRPLSSFASFLGGRVVDRYVPAAVDGVLSRSEFYTSYTPYQPEASQGLLQALFEFQSLWVELTQMEVANASLYDGATAAGEAMLMCHRAHAGQRFLVPASLPWEERSVLENYAEGPGIHIAEVPFDGERGALNLARLKEEVARGDVFGVLIDQPNGLGHLEPAAPEIKRLIGDVPLAVSADPLSLTVLEPPGSWGADIVVGEGQGFGAAPSYGGPLLGLFACRRELVRFAPGRIVGATVDAHGRRAYTLTLQTREQHIRRSRATSNICTNQSLLALAFVAYASVVGPRGLERLQGRISEQARAAADALGRVDGLSAPRFSAPFLGDFTIDVPSIAATEFLDRLRRRGVLGGVALADPRPGRSGLDPHWIRVSASESTDATSIRRYERAARLALGHSGGVP
ncbi:MAG TPA: aminomethyl-transferring glycine dehydrogenase subunit GcvPA [Thermoplasmata archaeon]|nr:aminomethyl-transferring glycine dehydrogenase subunit GcvPA [Thermoplasmata archaeon]